MDEQFVEMVPSLSSPGAGYEITRGDAGIGLHCSCPRASFRKKGATDECSHLLIFRAAEALIEKCAKAGHLGAIHPESRPVLCRRCLVALMAASARKVRKHYQPKKRRAAR